MQSRGRINHASFSILLYHLVVGEGRTIHFDDLSKNATYKLFSYSKTVSTPYIPFSSDVFRSLKIQPFQR